MAKKLNRKQRMLRWTKKHKVKAPLHTAVALIVSIVLLALFSVSDAFLGAQVEAETVAQESDTLLTMTMVGDMMFGRYVAKVGERYGYEHLFQRIQPYLNQSDLVTGNFENPILSRDPETYPIADKAIRFYADPAVTSALKKVGFTSVNLANNHMMDYGAPGLIDTRNAFQQSGLETVGAGRNRYDAERILYQEVNGLKVATVGVTDTYGTGFAVTREAPGVLTARPQTILPLVEKAKKKADLVVVHVHWGVEYDNNVHPRQQVLGRALVDAGADIVIGHHPHVLEPVEFYKDSVILYSLGNFIFDQGWSRTRETALVQYRLRADGKARLEIHPMVIREGQPRPLHGWLNTYRREKIYLQLAEEMVYTEAWKKKWTREDHYIYHEWDHSKILNGDSEQSDDELNQGEPVNGEQQESTPQDQSQSPNQPASGTEGG